MFECFQRDLYIAASEFALSINQLLLHYQNFCAMSQWLFSDAALKSGISGDGKQVKACINEETEREADSGKIFIPFITRFLKIDD